METSNDRFRCDCESVHDVRILKDQENELGVMLWYVYRYYGLVIYSDKGRKCWQYMHVWARHISEIIGESK